MSLREYDALTGQINHGFPYVGNPSVWLTRLFILKSTPEVIQVMITVRTCPCAPHRVGHRGQGRALDGRPLVTPVVPEDDATRVRSAEDQVRVELGETGRHHRGLAEHVRWNV